MDHCGIDDPRETRSGDERSIATVATQSRRIREHDPRFACAEVDIEQLPEDGIAGGFDNVDAALDLSSSLLESYLETIDAALDVAFLPGPPPESTI